ncbi:hypothetical protein [Streptomyces poriferorum]|uniref:Alpha/beta hydrolase n=1 Tax=Streptomyces poriferorum TaxID=2798799 RepID=A0ABY9J5V8_9ACTN|nr:MULTISPECIES: hypothetical protein [unclassified Streptomyces]MDP5315296.1 hypothetical protein [Streptomyces sp. Alt4]WLQ61633.1 hypothetical protein P8A19_10475 [Streptomyces sp. Alt2]
MACVHGIGQQVQGEERLRSAWWPALSDGLRWAGAEGLVTEADVAVAFYGDLFRPAGQFLSAGDPPYTAGDVEEGFERELLAAWWQAAAEVDAEVVPPDAVDTLVATPRSVQAALRALSGSKFFADLALRAVVADLKQVRAYLTDQETRDRVRGRVMARIGTDTRVVVAHSLGSVVAYEALCALPGHGVRALVTIGSPLGIPHLVVHRLRPAPTGTGRTVRGVWPGGENLVWTNLAATGDVVALVKDLRPVFGPRVRSALLSNGSHAHDATAYLTDALCGRAIAGGLA